MLRRTRASMIHVIANIELQPGQRAAFLKEYGQLLPKIRGERGCLEYVPAVDAATNVPLQAPPRPDVITVVEKWADLAALEAHLSAPHVGEFLARHQKAIAKVSLQILESAV